MHRFRLQLAELLLLVALAAILLNFTLLQIEVGAARRLVRFPWVELGGFLLWLAAWGGWVMRDWARAEPEERELSWHAPLMVATAAGAYLGIGLTGLAVFDPWSSSILPVGFQGWLILLALLVFACVLALAAKPTIKDRLLLWIFAESIASVCLTVQIYLLGIVSSLP